MDRVPSLLAGVATVLALGLAGACGASSGDGGSGGGATLTGAAARGQELFGDRGCAGCHGGDGEGGIAPALAGIAGTERELVDGTTVVADAEYLRRSIADPDAQIVAGWSVRMPPNSLGEDDVDALAAYIEQLEPTP